MSQKNIPIIFAVTLLGLVAYCAWLFSIDKLLVTDTVASEPSPTGEACTSPSAGGPLATRTVDCTPVVRTSTPSPTITTTPPVAGPKLEITLPIAKTGAKPDEMLFGGEKFLDLMRPLCRIAPGCLSQALTGSPPPPGQYHALVTLVKDPTPGSPYLNDENYQYYVVTVTGFGIAAPPASPTATATDPGGSPSPGTSPSPDSSPGQGGGGGGGTGWLPNLLFGSQRQVSIAK